MDAQTTPRWLRPFQLLFLAVVALAFFDASFHALSRPSFRQYLMGWKMFTVKSTRGTDHRAEVQWALGEPYESVDLHSYFPSKWGSGHRYSRFRDKRRLRLVAGALCHRLEKPARLVKIIQIQWPVRAGDISREGAQEEVMAVHRCDRPMPIPGGRFMPLHPDLSDREDR